MIITDDIAQVGDNLEEIHNKLDEWRKVLKGKGLRINRNKTEYIVYNFGGRYQEVEG